MSRASVVVLAAVVAASCGSSPSAPSAPEPTEQTPSTPPPTQPEPEPASWNVAAQGVPKIVTHTYIELNRVSRISKYRSGIGHDYSDAFETCRTMKHYFSTPTDASAVNVRIYAPFSGQIVRTIQEWAGVQIHIASRSNPAFTAVLFHVNPTISLADGTEVSGGQTIGRHIGNQTMSDFALMVNESGQRRLVSPFQAMTDNLFAKFQARGVISRGQMIISKAARDASPLVCQGQYYADSGSLNNWVALN